MPIQPYLFFEGRCEEAAEFYGHALGAKVTLLLRYKDGPDGAQPGHLPPGSQDKVMHMSMTIGDSMLQASDGHCSGRKDCFQGFSLSLRAHDAAEATRMFNALAEGGQVQMPLSQTFFSPMFGMVADRFGVSWMVIVED